MSQVKRGVEAAEEDTEKKIKEDEDEDECFYMERRKRERLEERWEQMGESAVKTIDSKTPLEQAKLVLQRVSTFEKKLLPRLKEKLGDSADWLPRTKTCTLEFQTDNIQCPPFFVHFASVYTQHQSTSGCMGLQKIRWCYDPVNDWIVNCREGALSEIFLLKDLKPATIGLHYNRISLEEWKKHRAFDL